MRIYEKGTFTEPYPIMPGLVLSTPELGRILY